MIDGLIASNTCAAKDMIASDIVPARLQELAANPRSLNTPWIVAGDWNMTPDELKQSNWLSVTNACVVAPQAATCNSKTYDFYLEFYVERC